MSVRRILGAALFSLAVTGAGLSAPGGAQAAAVAPDGPAQRVIVTLKPEVAQSLAPSGMQALAARQVAAVSQTSAATAAGAISRVYTRALSGYAATLTPAAIFTLRADPAVASVTPDGIVRIADTQTSPPWGLDRIDERTQPTDGVYAFGSTGAAVRAYVIDTGVRLTHSEFGGRAISGYDFYDDDADASDCDGHGTHVAGPIAGSTYGVAKQAQIVSLRVFGCSGNAEWSDLFAALDWVVTNHPPGTPGVVNMSLTGGRYSVMDDAVARVTAAGISVVVAAGNDYALDACLKSPAGAPSALTVGATRYDDLRAYFSNVGPCVDLFAPGEFILSASNDSNNASEYNSGTSMATPHVAGAVARYLQSNPTSTPAQVHSAIQAAATQGVVQDAQSTNSGLLYVAPATATLPSAPTAVTAAAGDGRATISWEPPLSDGGAAITEYVITGSPGGTTYAAPDAARALTVSGLTNGTSYTFTVRATNSAGTGPASTPSNAVTPTPPGGGTVINETFAAATSAFTTTGGSWGVSGGRYRLNAPASTAVPNANLAVHGTIVNGDFVLTAQGSTTATSNAFNDFSVVFGYTDAANYWYASFNESNDSGTNGIFRVTGGTTTELADFPTTITAGTLYPIRVEKVGGAVSVYRSGAVQATVSGASFSAGRVGFGTKNDGGIFDDLIVSAGAAGSAPDLVVTAISTSPVAPQPGDPVTFSATIKNQGTATTTPGIVHGVLFRVDGESVSWSDTSVAALAPGESRTVTANSGPYGSAPWPAVSGTHTVTAQVDDQNRVPGELDEANNTLTTSLIVGSAGAYDLVVTSVSASPAAPTPGQPVTFSAVVTNQGTAPTPSGVIHGVLFTVDGSTASWSDTRTAGIAAGASVTLTASGGPFNAATWNATLGTHTVVARVDDLDRIPGESDEDNNTRSTTLTVGGGAGQPNLVVTDVSWTPSSPATGSAVTFSATIANTGTAATATGVVHGVAFSVDGTAASWSDNSTASLAAGASRTVTANTGPSGSSTWSATSGSHTVLARVDDVNRIAESNEADNTLSETLSVTGGTTTAYPTSVAVDAGTLRAGTAAALVSDNNAYYQVDSTTTGTRTATWTGTFTGVPNSLASLSIGYKGSNSTKCTQVLSIFEYVSNTWVSLDSRTVGASEVLLTPTPTGPLADYVSGTTGAGTVQLRLTCTTTKNFYTKADLMRLTFS